MPKKGSYRMTRKIVEKYDLADPNVWPDFETEDFARKGLSEVIRVLEEHNIGDEDDDLLDPPGPYDQAIKKLKSCSKGERDCQSPACPVCVRTFRRWAVSHGLKVMEKDKKVLFVTFVPEPPKKFLLPYKFDAKVQNRVQF